MEEKAMLEARVWSRITGEKIEEYPQTGETSGYLNAECAAICLYSKMVRCFPKDGPVLLSLAKENIKYLKAMHFVQTGHCYYEKTLENLCFPCWKDALRQRIMTLQALPRTGKIGCNWEKQQEILLRILGKLL